MKGAVALRKPVDPAAAIDTTVTNVGNAYVTLVTAMPLACSAILVGNTGVNPMLLATGSAGNEVNTGIVIPPNSQCKLLPIEIPKGVRLSVKTISPTLTTQSSGVVYASFFA